MCSSKNEDKRLLFYQFYLTKVSEADMTKNVISASVAAIGLAFSVGASAADFSDDEIRLGVLTDMSGPYSTFQGEGAVEAAKLAIEDFGSEVNGVPITLVVEDHRNNAQRGTSVTRRWAERDGVDALVEVGNY